jgi:hypothetical protein
MRRVCIALLLLLAACASSDNDRPRPGDRSARGGSRMRDMGPMLVDIIPQDTWWHEPALATPLNLTSDQFAALDRIANDQRENIARLQRDLPIATRDLRGALDANPATEDDIMAAAHRVRDIRASLFDREAQMLSAERLVLTKDQWSKLLDELQRQRDDRGRGNDDNRGQRGGYPRGGRGRPWGE